MNYELSIKSRIEEALKNALEQEGIADVLVQVSIPTDISHGDYTSNVAMIAAKKLGKNPMEVAEGLKASLEIDGLEKIEVVKPGFLNFWLKSEFIIEQLHSENSVILEGAKRPIGSQIEGDSIATLQNDKRKKVIVEYSSPNIAKPFTVGHLRSTIIGDAVANLLEYVGYEVFRDNHVGDWGTQFGKQIYAIKAWGDESTIENAENPVKELVALYVRFHEEAEKDTELEEKAREWFKKLEDGDAEARRLWQKCIDWSWKEFQKIYDELGVSFTENGGKGYGESYFEDKMGAVLAELEEKKLLTNSEGARLVMYPEEILPPLMIVKKDGATLYATRDLATDKFRLSKYGEDIKIINEVGIEQELYFRQLYTLEEMLGWYKKEQRVHLKHGHFRFKDQKMSTRKGNVIWLEDVIAEAKKRAMEMAKEAINYEGSSSDALEKRKELTKKRVDAVDEKPEEFQTRMTQIAIGALKWNDLKRSSHMDVVFDWDDILNMQGNSGPYMQYTYVRTQSILRKANVILEGAVRPIGSQTAGDSIASLQNDKTLEPEELLLLRTLIHFDEIVAKAAEELAPSHVATYLFDLAQKFNNFYQKHTIVGSEQEVFRLGLTTKVGEVIKSGLGLLGIQVPEKM